MKDTEITKESYNKSATQWSEKHWTYEQEKDLNLILILEKFVKLLGGKGLVLDAGCGSGRDSKYLLEHKIQIIGIDFSDGMLKEARKRVLNGDFRKMDMKKLEFADNQFDGIWACASLLHFPKNEVSKALEEFRRVLKPNGILFASVKEGVGERIETEKYGPRFFAYYELTEFENKIKESGFNVIASWVNKGKKWNWIVLFATPKNKIQENREIS
jgi:ubiquinone/menaquinone biosynthesis C-methylase UbiE